MEPVHYRQRQTQHPGARGKAAAAAPEPQQPNRSDKASAVKTLVVFSEATRFTPVNNQAHDRHQATEVALAEEEGNLQPPALCSAADNY